MKMKIWFVVPSIVAISFAQSAYSNVFYVASSGSNTSPYDSWAKAATDPQVAIELAADIAGGPHQVWVKKGVYKSQFNPHTETLEPREYCFALRNNVGVYGGFAGTETLLEQRDPETNQTILSGDRGIPDTWHDGTPIVDGSGNFNPPPTGDPSQDLPVWNNSTNVYHVVYNPDQSPVIDASALLDGVIVTGGNANGVDQKSQGGGMCGGMYDEDSSPTLTNCTFSGNSATYGGGIHSGYYHLQLTNCTFSGNSATYGGGMWNSPNSYGTLTNCTFSDNSATWGGGMYIYWSSPILINCTFSGNSATNRGGGLHTWTETLTNCTFSENSAPEGGGVYGGTKATSSIFWGNTGGEFSECTNPSVRYSIVAGDISGFGIGCSNADPLLGSFGYYGGVTNCYSLSAGSPAINAGASVYRVTSDNNTLIYLLPGSDPDQYFQICDGTEYDPTGQTIELINSHDQRGWWRSGQVDMGSYEYGAAPSPTPAPPTSVPWIHDYDGDGTSDIALFRPSAGLWAIRGVTRVYFGSSTDRTVPGDYDGDGTTDIGIFRSSSGLWALRGVTRSYFGSGSDSPQAGDYNGDGRWDIGLFRPSSGLWAIRGITRVYFGGSTDTPAPGYYAGSTLKNIGIFRGSSGLWAIRGVTRSYFGSSSDTVVPGDYNGDGSWDVGIFRGTSGLWAVRGVTRSYFGSGSDQPVPADYQGDGRDDVGIFRSSSGLWAVRGVTRAYFGSGSDIPVTR